MVIAGIVVGLLLVLWLLRRRARCLRDQVRERVAARGHLRLIAGSRRAWRRNRAAPVFRRGPDGRMMLVNEDCVQLTLSTLNPQADGREETAPEDLPSVR